MNAGTTDLAAASAALRSRLPEPLAPLAEIAYNYRWSWTPGGPELFASVDPKRWEACAANPVRLLQETHPDRLAAVAGDPAFLERLAELAETLGAALAEETLEEATVSHDAPAAFFCAEYAVHGSLPVYSGGLGVLAGDILKEASDRALPLVAVGLMYRHGYFRQRIDASGWQHEYWVETDPDRVPGALVTGEDGEPVTVIVSRSGDRELVAQIWRVDVGRVPLLLLDADRPENDVADRWITSRLYVGDGDVRLSQYLLLGIGGVRALRALGVEPGVVHLNEGHAAFATLELARTAREADGGSADDAFEAVRRRTVFTTHTPVPAGNDTYPAEQVAARLGGIAAEMGIDAGDLVRRGRTNPGDEGEPFGVTQFALRSSRIANGVSARHGEVARGMWHGMWPDRAVEDVPIAHVTNGVHIPTWIGAPLRELLDRHLGEGWMDRAVEPSTWDGVEEISDADLWAARSEQRRELIELVQGPQRHRAPAARRHGRVRPRRRRGARPGRADDRLRPPRRDLQAAGPAAARRRPRALAARRRRPARAVPARRQGAPARRRRQAPRPAAVRDEGPPAGRPARRLPGRLRRRARRGDDARLRHLGQRAAPAAGGVRHLGHQVGRQRRPAAVGARRLVARGLRRLQRLGDRRRGRRRPRRAGLAPRPGALRAAARAGAAALLRPRRGRPAGASGWRWSAPRCARSARTSAPGA